MLTYIAKRLSSFFIGKNFVSEEDREVYDYCFEVMITTVINMLVLLIIGFISKSLIPTILFSISFILMRASAGGFHAETHIGCFLVLMSVYGIYLVLLETMSCKHLNGLMALMSVLSIGLVVVLAPVGNANKEYSEFEHRKLKLKSRCFCISVICLVWGLHNLLNVKYLFSITSGICAVSISLIAGKLKNNYQKKEGKM